jgi:hypothetical protein
LVTGTSSAISRLTPVPAFTANSLPRFDCTTISVRPPGSASIPFALKPGVYWKAPVIRTSSSSPSVPSLAIGTR